MRFSRVRLCCCLSLVSVFMLLLQDPAQAAVAKSRESAKTPQYAKRAVPVPQEIVMSEDVRLVADWVLRNDKQFGRPFMIADKANGLLFAFRANGEIVAKGRALYGAVRTDEMTQEQADKTWEEMVAADMITPAGIFPAHGYVSPAYGDSIRFAEYANSNLLIHRAPAEWRRKNLQTPKADRIRVTYGCINVLPEFMDKALLPVFSGESTIFILPETQSPREFFAIDDFANGKLRTAGR
jgi:hypothetical protein